MPKKLFGNDGIFINRLKMHPELDFFIYNSEVYLDGTPNISGSKDATYKNVPKGYVSLYELNINRDPSQKANLAYPFVQRGFNLDLRSNLNSFSYIPPYGQEKTHFSTIVTGSYPLSASITRIYSTASTHTFGNNTTHIENKRARSLYNVGKQKYSVHSKRFLLQDEVLSDSLNMINVPSIFYGSSINKGSVTLKYFITGTLIASAIDDRKNGELIQNYGSNSGSVIGLVYYDEGVFVFPSSSTAGNAFTANHFISPALDSGNSIIYDASSAASASWRWFGAGANDGITHHATLASASFSMNFKGISYKNTMTLICSAEKGEYNWSNSPTFLDQTATDYNSVQTSSMHYHEFESPIKNVVSSSYVGHDATFAKTTYITKIGIYDKHDNLIMVAETARPYRKEEDKDLTFKLKYDLL